MCLHSLFYGFLGSVRGIAIGKIVDELFDGERSGFSAAHRQSDGAVGRDVQRLGHNAVRRAAENQLGQDAQSQSALDHAHDGVIVPRREVHARGQLVPVKQLGDFGAFAVLEQQKRLPTERLERHFLLLGQRMLFRQHGEQVILRQRNGVKLRVGRQAQKSAVHAPLLNPFLDFRVITEQKFVVNAGIILLKRADDVGQPVRRRARKGSDADEARLHSVYVIDLHAQLGIVVADLLREGEQARAVRGQEDTVAAASLEQRQLPFAFQIVNHATDAGLRVVERFGGLGKAAVAG